MLGEQEDIAARRHSYVTYLIAGLIGIVITLLLAGCSTTKRFSGAIKDAKQAGRPVLIYALSPHRIVGGSDEPVSIHVDFINTSLQPLRSVTFYFLPYRNFSLPLPQPTKRELTAYGPFSPNHAYQFHRPKSDEQKLWPNLNGNYICPTLVGMTITKANGSAMHIGKSDIARYLASNVRTTCIPPRPSTPVQ